MLINGDCMMFILMHCSLCCLKDDCGATNVTISNCSIVYENGSELGATQITESAASNAVLTSQ